MGGSEFGKKDRGVVFAGLCLAAAACGGQYEGGEDDGNPPVPPQASVSGCAGTYRGTYMGAASGQLSATLDRKRRFNVSFSDLGMKGNTVTGEGTIGNDGGVSLLVGIGTVQGRLEVANCSASGSWTSGAAKGTWKLVRT